MPRIRLSVPKTAKLIYTVKLPIYIQHINYGNHLGADSLIAIIHEARVQFLKHYGMCEKNIDHGVGLMIASLASTHYNQGVHGNTLKIEIFVDDIQNSNCDFYYQIFNDDDQILAIATTNTVFIDRQTQKIAKIPEKLRLILE